MVVLARFSIRGNAVTLSHGGEQLGINRTASLELRPELRVQTAIPMCGGSQIRILAVATESVWQGLKSIVPGFGSLRVPSDDDERRSKQDCWGSGCSCVLSNSTCWMQ